MRAALPAGVCAAVVAGEARLADLRRLHRAELQDVPLGVVVDVRLSRTMTALASELGALAIAGWRPARASCP